MYDQGVGKHCSVDTCKQKDWLPIKCKYCQKVFCADHCSIQSHNCSKYEKQYKKVYECPLCSKVININANLSVDQNFEIHQAMDCQRDYSKNVKVVQKCKAKNCNSKITQLNKYICKNCKEQVCLKHRLQQDHQCRQVFA